MNGRATKQATSAAALPEDSSDAVRIRHQLDAWANAAHRTPRLVTMGGDEPDAGPPGKTPPAAKKRTRSAAAAARPKAPRATKAAEAKIADAKIADVMTTDVTATDVAVPEADKANLEPQPPIAPLEPEAAIAAPAMPEPVTAVPDRALASRAFALVAALALAAVAAYFSVAGMAEIFPGDPVAVMVLAGTMEAGKLVIAGWLAAHWRRTNWKMRTVLVTLVAGLALINAAGVFGKLVEAHVSVAATSRSGVTERIEALDARVKAQSAVVADLDSRIAQIDRAVDESTRLGRVTRAINIATQQRVTRDGLDSQRQAATATLVGLQAQRAALTGERSRIEASAGPIQYLAMMAGVSSEVAVRWLILLMVLCCDPAAIALTVAAAGVRARDSR
ncbi:hypothetical protein [Bradyrhizobium roseum]|uniref:hypothetical protein n=1 Tax=Bradyrhizobium roseum TaxID=3056648 RepID=UPI00260C2499|nr:hypothetical protein [Bradyrhizobium roseus]WKA30394.1 hypothetical protein QUH67_09590 [Bradyrhizobium roseus]